MSETVRLSNFASIANAVFNSVSANATAITGISVAGQTINATPVFTGNTTVANLAFSGAGVRITGDFSNATFASRVAFQTSATNASTTLSVIPSGNNTQSDFFAYNSSDPNNASVLLMRAGTLETSIRSAATGTGTLLPMAFNTGGAERMRIAANGNIGIGTSSPWTRLVVEGSISAGAPNDVTLFMPQNSAIRDIANSASTMYFDVSTGGSAHGAFDFRSSNAYTSRMYISTSGNVGIGTSSPDTRLTVQSTNLGGTAGDVQRLARFLTTAGNVSQLDITTRRFATGADWTGTNVRFGRTVDVSLQNFIDFGVDGVSASSGLGFGTGGVASRMVIDGSGNVGIGTSFPARRFEVLAAGSNIPARLGNSLGNMDIGGSGGTTVDIDTRNWAMGLLTGGVERVRIDTSGNVGIGTTPSNRLDVAVPGTSLGAAVVRVFNSTDGANAGLLGLIKFGSTAPNYGAFTPNTVGVSGAFTNLLFGTETAHPAIFYTNNVERMRIDSTGRVGIGMAPIATLDVTAASNPHLRVLANSGIPFLQVNSSQGAGYAPGIIQLTRTSLTGGITPSNQSVGEIRWDGIANNGAYTIFAMITSSVFTNGTNGGDSDMVFHTSAAGASAAERMRITNAGNVGIGTGTPFGRLAVASAAGQVGFNTGTSSSPERGNIWYDTDGSGWRLNIGKRQSGTFTPQMTIVDNGNIGIGNTSPTHALSINGALRTTALSTNYAQSDAVAITVNTTTPTAVCSVTLTTLGKPVLLLAAGDRNPLSAGAWHYGQFYRDSTPIGKRYIGQQSFESYNQPFAHCFVDTPGAGTYSYQFRVWQGSGSIQYGEEGNGQAPTIIAMEMI